MTPSSSGDPTLAKDVYDHLLRDEYDLAGAALERRFRLHGGAEPESLLYNVFLVARTNTRYRDAARRYLSENLREPVCGLMLSALDAEEGRIDSANSLLAEALSASPLLDDVLGRPDPTFVEKVRDCEARRADLPESTDLYHSAQVRLGWFHSYRAAVKGPRLSNDVAASLHAHFHLVSRHLGNASRVTNFGCFVPEVDQRLSRAFPGVEFIGIDRDADIIDLARTIYPELTLRAGDIRDLLEGDGILVHTKTATFILPHALQTIYHRAAEQGIRKILVLEPWGLDGISRQYPKGEFNLAFMRSSMMIHDYPKLLRRAGYAVTESILLPFSWVGMGRMQIPMHLWCVVAER